MAGASHSAAQRFEPRQQGMFPQEEGRVGVLFDRLWRSHGMIWSNPA